MFKIDPLPEDNLEGTADAIIEETPEPQQHAIDEAAKASADDPGSASQSVEVDALGVPWDPAIHATSGETGRGIRTAKGTWRKRKGLKGSASYIGRGAANQKPIEEDPTVTEQRTREHQNRMAGAMAGTMLVRMSAAVGGEAFLPRTIKVPGGLEYNEEQFLQSAFGDYFVAKGITDIPPGMVLCSALAMYYLPRFQQPEVRARGGRFIRWLKDKGEWIYFKFKYRGKKPPERAKSRTDTPDSNVSDISSARANLDV